MDEKGGWAATARVQAKLADLGTLTLSGAKSTYGFGPLESKINERQQDNREQYDIASSLELGKFFPQKIGLSIPFYIGYSKAIANPYYNPLNPEQNSRSRDDIAPGRSAIYGIGIAGSVLLSLAWLAIVRGCR